MTKPPSGPALSRILSAIMFVSGASGLMFETLWFRQAGLAFGNSVWASSLVLASFMAGLAIGNGLVAHFGARILRPLRFYALLEVAIGGSGVLLVFALPAFGGWLVPLWRPFLDEALALNTLRIGFAFAMLVIPATAMGATLPVLVKALRARDPNFGSVLGRLYGWNTLGAVLGALAGEVALIEWFGVRGTAFAAGGANLVAALAAFAIARGDSFALASPAAQAARARVSPAARSLLVAAFLSGATLLALEVVWFRFLHLFIENTSAGFALVLAIVLAGIGLGGASAGAWLRRDPGAIRFAAAVALAAGAFTAVSYRCFALAIEPYGTVVIRAAGDIAWLSLVLMFPVSLLSGLIFTMTGAALEREVAPETRAAGWLTLANTLGGGLGALFGGFVLLPVLGVEAAIFALAATYALVSLCLLPAGSAARTLDWRRAIAVAAVAFALALVVFPFGRLEASFLRGVVERMGEAGSRVVAYREGLTETVIYLERRQFGEVVGHRLVTGGFGMASTNVWARRYMKQYVYWPVALHPAPKRALLISFGIGNTAKALVDTRELERIDVVDISRDVLEMSEIVHADSEPHPLRDPRVQVHVEDGRFYLLTTTERYDLITSEPPPPKHSGIVNLYTREYFELVRDRLAEGGINTYWLPVHSLHLEDTRAIIRAYCDVFDDCSLWTGAGLNWMLVGTRNARWPVSHERFVAQWSDPLVGPELRALGFEGPEQLGATFLADAEHLRSVTQDVLPLVDDHPKRLTDGFDPKRTQQHLAWMDAQAARERFSKSPFIREAWPASLREASEQAFVFQDAIDHARGILARRPPQRGERVRNFHAAQVDGGYTWLPLWWLGIDADALAALDRQRASGAAVSGNHYLLGARSLAKGDFETANAEFAAIASERPDARLILFLRLYALCRAGDPAAAAVLAETELRGARLDAGDRAFLEWLSESFGVPAFR